MVTLPVTDRIELRLLQEAHAGEMWALIHRNRAHLRPWMTWIEQTRGVDDTLEFIQMTRRQFADRKMVAFGIWFDGALAGTIDLHHIDHINHSADIGYWLNMDVQGRGIMTAACAAVVRYGFHELDLHRIAVLVAAGNVRSRAIPQRLGFTQEGVMRDFALLHGTYHDMVIYGMLRSEWRRPQPR